MSLRTSFVVVGLVLTVGCKDDALPKFTPELMPPAAAPLVLGVSTEADVLAKLGPAKPPDAEGRARDIGPGQFNDHHGIFIREPGVGELYVWPMGQSTTPLLGRFELRQDGACDWLKANVGKLDGAENCPGNRVTGVKNDNGYLCMSMDDGRVVHAECHGRTIEYWIGKQR